MSYPFVSTSGKLHVTTVMDKDQLFAALEAYMNDPSAQAPEQWCLADLRVLDRAMDTVRQAVLHVPTQVPPVVDRVEQVAITLRSCAQDLRRCGRPMDISLLPEMLEVAASILSGKRQQPDYE